MDVFRCGWSQQSPERVFWWSLDSSSMALMLELDRRSNLSWHIDLLIYFKSRPHLYEWGGFYR